MKRGKLLIISTMLLNFGLLSCAPKTIVGEKGDQGPQGEKGDSGVSIISVVKTNTKDNIDTYTIMFSDGSTSFFEVTNGVQGPQGIQGVPGQDGHTPIVKINKDGNWEIDGVDTGVKAQGPKGDKGENGKDGVSIVSVTKLKEEGLEITYIITYSDGRTDKFIVKNGQDGHNGQDGTQGEQGIQGVPGKDGHTPSVTIGSNGNWFIDDVDSGCKAQGPKGDKGDNGRGIISIDFANQIDNISTYIITYSDGTTDRFTIINGLDGKDGKNGEQGIQGIQGLPGKDGHVPVIEIGANGNWYIDGSDTTIQAIGPKGDKGEKGDQGQPGTSIISVKKSKTEGLIDTYIITYSDGNTDIFTVTNGKDGEKGEQGIQGIQGEPGKDGKAPTITINENNEWVIDGVNSHISCKGQKGDKGQDGRSIISIALKSSKDNIDTYVITYSDETTDIFTVRNGIDGQKGEQGIQGEPGKDGITPTITINENNEWVVNGENSGVLAIGQTGDSGLSAYEIYLKYHPDYNKTEDEWLSDLIYGKLDLVNPEISKVNYYFENNLVETDEFVKGKHLELPTFSIDQPGYHISNWYIDTSYTGNVWIFDVNTCSYDELNLYAKKEPNKYKVHFFSPVGILEEEYSTALYNEYFKFNEPLLSNSSLSFDGWYDLKNNITYRKRKIIYDYLEDIEIYCKYHYTAAPILEEFELANRAVFDSNHVEHKPIHKGNINKLDISVDINNSAQLLMESQYFNVNFSDPTIAEFNSDGTIKALNVGTTLVTLAVGDKTIEFTYTVEN